MLFDIKTAVSPMMQSSIHLVTMKPVTTIASRQVKTVFVKNKAVVSSLHHETPHLNVYINRLQAAHSLSRTLLHKHHPDLLAPTLASTQAQISIVYPDPAIINFNQILL